jgi:hypothetical protein
MEPLSNVEFQTAILLAKLAAPIYAVHSQTLYSVDARKRALEETVLLMKDAQRLAKEGTL